jgi:glucose/arabinose dehydrogenase
MGVNNNILVVVIVMLICIISIQIEEHHYFFEAHSLGLEPPRSNKKPIIHNPDLKIELVASGIELPTSMTFIDRNDLLVLEKEKGTVLRIINGTISEKPIIDLNVATGIDRGLLGVSFSKINDGNKYVFLYFTESRTKDGEDVTEGKDPLGNRLYRYELENNKLVHPKLLLDLPVSPNRHPGGQIQIGTDENVYVIIGDIDHYTKAQNNKTGQEPDGTGGILRITQNGEPVGNGILGDSFPLNLYYAYGIRNSFGIDFDPVTGKLWDTENGPDYGDEINLVEPGFNSGWNKVQGFWKPKGQDKGDRELQPDNLVDFNGKGKYSSPEFAWNFTVGPTALKFLTSDKLGKKYENDMFVGDFHYGNIYHFDLEKKRTGLLLEHSLSDKIGDDLGESEIIKFGAGFGGITDLVIGPDGYLYILSLLKGGHNCDSNEESCISYSSEKGAAIMRIVPTIANSENKIN